MLVLVVSMTIYACKKKEGCTDSNAINYDSSAEKNNGTCTYNTDTSTVNNDTTNTGENTDSTGIITFFPPDTTTPAITVIGTWNYDSLVHHIISTSDSTTLELKSIVNYRDNFIRLENDSDFYDNSTYSNKWKWLKDQNQLVLDTTTYEIQLLDLYKMVIFSYTEDKCDAYVDSVCTQRKKIKSVKYYSKNSVRLH